MKFKSVDSLSISECCEQLNLRKEDLPEALQNFNEPTERKQLLITRLKFLLSEDKSAIDLCKTIEQYEGYLSTWVDGLYHGYARMRIAQLKAEAEELAFYNNNKDSILGCEAYLRKYPKGRFVKEAQSLLTQKKKSRKTRNIIFLILFLIAAGVFAYFNYVPVSYVNVDDNAELNNFGSEISLSISTDAIISTVSATSSEDWIDCRVSGKTLYISANTNSKSKRSATVTISAHSSFFGTELSDSKQTTITVSQETGYASYLSVTNNDIHLTANGGQSSVSINTDGIFAVSTAPASWVTTSVSGKTLNLECGKNSGIARNTYLIIKSGAKTLRLDITQVGKSATRLDVSTSNAEFSADGGNRTIEIYTDGECQISTQPESWAHATINGNLISLRVDENLGIKRTDYFVIKSGSYTERINILQSGKSATRLSVSTENVSFSSSGGSRTISVSTDGEWKISTETNSWGHTSINGNTITLRADANDGDSRTDYFVVKSGSMEKRINISQDGSLATYLKLSKSTIEASRSGTGYNECYAVEVYTDGDNVTATTSASWIDVDIVGNNRIEIETSKNTGSRRAATIIVKADKKTEQIKVSQKGIYNCTNCYNWQLGYSTGQVWGVVGYYYVGWTQFPQYGWVQCPVCKGSGNIEN